MIQDAEFFLKGGRVGVLLIHGLTGTPNEMRLVGKGLNRAGFTVYGMQLAGHCGDEKDLLPTTWQDWYKSVEVAADKLRESVDYVFVAGLSMGAVLSLKLAADHPEYVCGVGVYGATFRYDGWSIPAYARYFYWLVTLFKALNIFQDRSFNEHPPYGLKDERLRATVSASMLSGDSAAAGLAGNPWPALAEMIYLSRQVRRQLPQVTAPCLIIHSTDDDIAHISNAHLVKKNVSGPVKTVWLNDSYHMITIDRERREVIQQSVAFFQDIVQQRLAAAGSDVPLENLFSTPTRDNA
jgi:carboxylesterase